MGLRACTTLIRDILILLKGLSYCLGASFRVGWAGPIRWYFCRVIANSLRMTLSSGCVLMSVMSHGFAIFSYFLTKCKCSPHLRLTVSLSSSHGKRTIFSNRLGGFWSFWCRPLSLKFGLLVKTVIGSFLFRQSFSTSRQLCLLHLVAYIEMLCYYTFSLSLMLIICF